MSASVVPLVRRRLAPQLGQGSNLAVASLFIDALRGNPDAEVTFQTFDDDGERKDPALARILHGTLEQHAEELERLNQAGAGIFLMVNEGDGKGRRAENVQRVRALFVDLDGAPPEPLIESPHPPHLIVQTSPEKGHAYWLVRDCPLEQFASLQSSLAGRFGGDPAVKDLPRVMRIPGFWHRKDPKRPWLVRIAYFDDSRRPAPCTTTELVTTLGLKEVSTTPLAARLRAGKHIHRGERDVTLFKLACSLRALGVAYAEAREKVLAALAKCEQRPGDTISQAAALEKLDRVYATYPEGTPFDCTDMGNAQRFAALHGHAVRHCYAERRWYVFRSGIWRPDDGDEIAAMAKATARTILQEAQDEASDERSTRLAKWAAASRSRDKLAAMADVARSEPAIPIKPEAFDHEPMLLGCENGVLDLRTGRLRPAQPDDYLTRSTWVAFDPAAECPLFERFLNKIFAGNLDLIAFVQRAAGYSMTGRTDEQCFFICYGSGGNGKTTLLGALRAALGGYAMQAETATFLKRDRSGANNDIAGLRGARFVTAIEADEGARLAEALVKQATGGDPMRARFLYQESFEFVPQFKLWLGVNHKPSIKGTDHAMWRRVRLIPFNVTITKAEKDGRLPDKLLAELPGILNWALAGCLVWQREGALGEPRDVVNATDEYRRQQDELGQWIGDRCAEGGSETLGVLFTNYKSWCESAGIRPETKPRFQQMLEERGHDKRNGTDNKLFYIGLRLAGEADKSASTARRPLVTGIKH